MSQKASRQNPNAKILVGTASWSDPGFVQHWFPKRLAAGERLRWYAEHFEMVEINSTFYAAPDPRMVQRWCRSTPDSFTFDVKLHRLLSRHSTAAKQLRPNLRRLTRAHEEKKVELTPALESAMIEEFLPSLEILRAARKLGSLLLQLSPSFSPRKHNLSELDRLLSSLSEYRVAIEFRNRHWVADQQLAATLDFLRQHAATLVLVDAPAAEHFMIFPSELNEITNPDLSYLRLHGRDAQSYLKGKTVAARFDYDYSDDEIEEVAKRSRALARSARQVHVVFNNNNLDYAPRAASRLRAALGQILKAPPRQGELFAKAADLTLGS
jgi:uncharacterized protein YecE (DUF72 family)